VILWFGMGGHELQSAAGEISVGASVSVPSVLGLLEAREKRVREEIARLREEAERVQAVLGAAEWRSSVWWMPEPR
jgi:hypothetical protein